MNFPCFYSKFSILIDILIRINSGGYLHLFFDPPVSKITQSCQYYPNELKKLNILKIFAVKPLCPQDINIPWYVLRFQIAISQKLAIELK